MFFQKASKEVQFISPLARASAPRLGVGSEGRGVRWGPGAHARAGMGDRTHPRPGPGDLWGRRGATVWRLPEPAGLEAVTAAPEC